MNIPSFTLHDGPVLKGLRSAEANWLFDKRNGHTIMWGKTPKEDMKMSPVPVILDMEVTTQCAGPGGIPCPFCSPGGTLINTNVGQVPIETLKTGDKVLGFNVETNSIIENVIEETYIRPYIGELICIELDDGKVLKLTPNHRVILKGGKEVRAEHLTEDDEIISISDYERKGMSNL
jgi:intein/homing endonuclease